MRARPLSAIALCSLLAACSAEEDFIYEGPDGEFESYDVASELVFPMLEAEYEANHMAAVIEDPLAAMVDHFTGSPDGISEEQARAILEVAVPEQLREQLSSFTASQAALARTTIHSEITLWSDGRAAHEVLGVSVEVDGRTVRISAEPFMGEYGPVDYKDTSTFEVQDNEILVADHKVELPMDSLADEAAISAVGQDTRAFADYFGQSIDCGHMTTELQALVDQAIEEERRFFVSLPYGASCEDSMANYVRVYLANLHVREFGRDAWGDDLTFRASIDARRTREGLKGELLLSRNGPLFDYQIVAEIAAE